MDARQTYQELLNGGKVMASYMVSDEYIYMDDKGNLLNRYDGTYGALSAKTRYEIYTEPKPKRKFYRRKWTLYAGRLYTDGHWCESKEEFDRLNQVVTEVSPDWEEIEI